MSPFLARVERVHSCPQLTRARVRRRTAEAGARDWAAINQLNKKRLMVKFLTGMIGEKRHEAHVNMSIHSFTSFHLSSQFTYEKLKFYESITFRRWDPEIIHRSHPGLYYTGTERMTYWLCWYRQERWLPILGHRDRTCAGEVTLRLSSCPPIDDKWVYLF